MTFTLKVLLGFGVSLIILALYLDTQVPDTVVVHRSRVVAFNCVTLPLKLLMYIGENYFNYEPYHWYRISSTPAPMGDHEQMKVRVYDSKIEDIPVRVYTPYSTSNSKLSTGIIFYHGGGFVGSSIEFPYHLMVMDLSNRTNCIIISIDYRLAPEHPYPAGLNDCLAVTKQVGISAEQYGIDRNSIYIAGDSAGGNFAAVINDKLIEDNNIHIKGTILLYPVMQLTTFNLPSHTTQSFGILTNSGLAKFITTYFNVSAIKHHKAVVEGQHVCRDEISTELFAKYLEMDSVPETCNEELSKKMAAVLTKDVSPLFNSNVTGLSPTIILLAEADLLRDEGILYYNRLKREGVDVQLIIYGSATHGFVSEIGAIVQPTQYNKLLDDVAKYIQQREDN